MPTSRPSSPAALSSSNIIGMNVVHAWLVDQGSGGTIADLKGGGNLTVDNATYVTDTYIGKALASSGTGEQAICLSNGTSIGAYPFAMGGIFTANSLPANGNGSCLMTCVDSLNDYGSGGLFAVCYIDNNSGVLVVTWRAVGGDSQGVIISTNAYTPNAINAWALRFTSYNTVSLVLNGVLTNTLSNPPTSSTWDVTLRLAGSSFLAHTPHSESANLLVSDSHVRASMWWAANGSYATAMTDAALEAQTGDPWIILAGAGGATTVTATGPSSGAVNAASTNFSIGVNATPISGTLTVTPASNKAGTFSPTTVSLTTGSPSATCTFTPTVSGAHTISFTNNGSLTNPSTIAYTVRPAVTFELVASPTDSTPQASLTAIHWMSRDVTDADNGAAPTDHGNAATTNGSGIATIPLPNSTLTNGQNCMVVYHNAAGTTGGIYIGPVT